MVILLLCCINMDLPGRRWRYSICTWSSSLGPSLTWRSGNETSGLGVGATTTAGIFTAEIIDTPPEGIVSVLRYSVNQTIVMLRVIMEMLLLTPFLRHVRVPAHIYHCVPFHRSSKCSWYISTIHYIYNSATMQWTDNIMQDQILQDTMLPLLLLVYHVVPLYLMILYTFTGLDHTQQYSVSQCCSVLSILC